MELSDFDSTSPDSNTFGTNGSEMSDKSCEKLSLGCTAAPSALNYEEDAAIVSKCGVDGHSPKDTELEDSSKVPY